MTIEEVKRIEDLFIPYDGLGKMKTFHNRETGQVVVVLYDPNIIGITKLKDILTLSPDALSNLNLYFKTRDENELKNIFSVFRKFKEETSIVKLMEPLQQSYNETTMKIAELVELQNKVEQTMEQIK